MNYYYNMGNNFVPNYNAYYQQNSEHQFYKQQTNQQISQIQAQKKADYQSKKTDKLYQYTVPIKSQYQIDLDQKNISYSNKAKSQKKSIIKNNLANIAYQEERISMKDDYCVQQGGNGSKRNNISTYANNYSIGDANLCGIINIGNNCYLNSGLQILARCSSFVDKLAIFYSTQYPFVAKLYKAFNTLLTEKVYDPSPFVEYFCKINKDFSMGEQSCSQNFIRTVLNNVNDEIKFSRKNCVGSYEVYKPKEPNEINAYKVYINENRIFPESEALSTFTCVTKSHTYGQCTTCHNVINNYSFSYSIDQIIYLDNIFQRSNFKEVIKENLCSDNKVEMECLNCKTMMEVEEETKIVKLPEILIFTLERFLGGTNKVEIVPDPILELESYVDPNLTAHNTRYELFAINIRFGSTKNFGHEICQIKIGNNWFEFNDSSASLKKKDYNNCSYGLYYKMISY